MIRKANLKQEGFKVMGEIIIPQGYKSALNLHDTQVAIKTVKDYFQHELTHRLHLLRVTAPLFVQPPGRGDRQHSLRLRGSVGLGKNHVPGRTQS